MEYKDGLGKSYIVKQEDAGKTLFYKGKSKQGNKCLIPFLVTLNYIGKTIKQIDNEKKKEMKVMAKHMSKLTEEERQNLARHF